MELKAPPPASCNMKLNEEMWLDCENLEQDASTPVKAEEKGPENPTGPQQGSKGNSKRHSVARVSAPGRCVEGKSFCRTYLLSC